MKLFKTPIFAAILSSALIFSSCETVQNANNSQKGGVIGAAAGAAIGAVVAKNNKGLGALIGGAVGGAAGAVIGRKMDKQAERIEETVPGAEVIRSEEGIQVILDENADVRFEFNSAELTAKAKQNINNLINVFQEYPDTNILVLGHTDSKGADDYNQKLSVQRAKSVVNYLMSQGISADRLTSDGVGESEPRYTNETEEGRAGNRRVEFDITANEKMIEEAEQEAQN